MTHINDLFTGMTWREAALWVAFIAAGTFAARHFWEMRKASRAWWRQHNDRIEKFPFRHIKDREADRSRSDH